MPPLSSSPAHPPSSKPLSTPALYPSSSPNTISSNTPPPSAFTSTHRHCPSLFIFYLSTLLSSSFLHHRPPPHLTFLTCTGFYIGLPHALQLCVCAAAVHLSTASTLSLYSLTHVSYICYLCHALLLHYTSVPPLHLLDAPITSHVLHTYIFLHTLRCSCCHLYHVDLHLSYPTFTLHHLSVLYLTPRTFWPTCNLSLSTALRP